MKTVTNLGAVLSVGAALTLACGCAAKQARVAEPSGVASRQAPSSSGSSSIPHNTPNTPTAANINISEEILRACGIPDSDAYFGFDSSRLTSFDHGPLDQVAVCFTTGPMAGRAMHLVGHADPRGTSDYNMTLGQSRADSVEGYLVGRGLRQGQLSTTSRGAMDATGTDDTGWAHDRRVDLLLAH